MVVPAPRLAAGGGVNRLAIDAGGGPGVIRLLRRADPATQRVVDRLQGAIVPPLVEVPPDGAPGWEVDGQVTPLASRAEDVEDGVEDVPCARLAGPAAGVDGDVGLDEGPLLVGDIAGIAVVSHPISTPTATWSSTYGTVT